MDRQVHPISEENVVKAGEVRATIVAYCT